ncbi:cbb3-type cytochrome oxidase subunit 3 [Pseudomonas sp. UBA6562]|uniref:cbb3-type cytochrome oxidase subunit 3 n=1 Tax=Pseudomonas sp. UBA6562 TaxID=1947332 RepID=UPI0025EA0CE4|nr:cbb3-type cytochrome c oxidase subunit 3 [Pseudomonas sp. UBA6562]
MDTGMIRGLGTLVVLVAFVGLALWVFSPRRKRDFDEATQLPFADEPPRAVEPTQEKAPSQAPRSKQP